MGKELDFGNTPVSRLLLALFVPSLVGMVFNSLFLVVDGMFVGRGIGPNGLAAINLFEPILLIFLGLGAMVGCGCSIDSAIQLSHNEKLHARSCVTTSFVIAFIISFIVMAISYAFPHHILRMVGTTSTLEPTAMEYYQWFIPSAFFMSLSIVGCFVIRLDGSPNYVMISNIIPTVINIVLDYVFIFKLNMGLRGAAMATNIGTSIGFLMVLYYMFYPCKTLRFTINIKMKDSGRILELGFPSFINETASAATCLLGNILFGIHLKDIGLAAFGTICYVTPIITTILVSLSSSMQPIISFNQGAGKKERVRKAFWFALIMSTLFSTLISAIIFVFPQHIAAIFLKPGIAAHDMASSGLQLYSVTYFFCGINIIIITYFQSIEKIRWSMILTILRGFVLTGLTFGIAPLILGHPGLWLAVPFAEFITFVICTILLLRHKKYE